jgi:hypothetical protein
VLHPITIDTGSGTGNAVVLGGLAGAGAQAVNAQVQSTGGRVGLTMDDTGTRRLPAPAVAVTGPALAALPTTDAALQWLAVQQTAAPANPAADAFSTLVAGRVETLTPIATGARWLPPTDDRSESDPLVVPGNPLRADGW